MQFSLSSYVNAYSILSFSGRSTNELWKNLYLRIANRFYEPLSRINSSNTDLKDLYFQRIFHEVVQCFYDELASSEFFFDASFYDLGNTLPS